MADPFAWHPEPELIGFHDEAIAREALERLGKATWDEALHYLYEEALRRPVGTDSYPAMRRRFFGDTNGPAPPPPGPATSARVLAEFREYERGSTTVLDAYIKPLVARYLQDLRDRHGGQEIGLHIDQVHKVLRIVPDGAGCVVWLQARMTECH